MKDLKDMTVEGLNEWALSWGSYAAAFDELARRLEEAEQKIAAQEEHLDKVRKE